MKNLYFVIGKGVCVCCETMEKAKVFRAFYPHTKIKVLKDPEA